MARTDKERFDEAVRYLHKHISSELAVSLNAARDKSKSDSDYGAEISLGGAKYWKYGSEDQHTAVRALLLCQKTFFKAPWAVGANGGGFDYAHPLKPDLTRQHYLKKTEEQVKNGLRAFIPVAGANHKALADVARDTKNSSGKTEWEILTRDMDPFPNMAVCFDALKFWLFRAGFVSLRWLAKTAPPMNAYTVNSILGDGVVINEMQMATMPRGYMFNFHRTGAPQVCHWGVSLGGGIGAAANTEPSWGNRTVKFRTGDKYYGTFPLADSLAVCKLKYASPQEQEGPVTIRQIDPSAVTTYN